MAGTLLENEKRPPVLSWLQAQLRSGALAEAVAKFVAEQQEVIDQAQLVVERVENACIVCHAPHFSRDHESTQPVCTMVEFAVNPETGDVTRR